YRCQRLLVLSAHAVGVFFRSKKQLAKQNSIFVEERSPEDEISSERSLIVFWSGKKCLQHGQTKPVSAGTYKH
ncbi:MAG: hypothetical protein AAFO85_17920, partial [Cyanobacteria bacterium J06598_4]